MVQWLAIMWISRLSGFDRFYFLRKGILIMAKCEDCGKKTTFGHSRSFSMHATNRKFRPNLQRVTVTQNGRRVKKVLCTRCLRTLSKTKTK